MYMYTVSFLKNGFEGGCDDKVYLTSHIFCVKMQFAYPFRTFALTNSTNYQKFASNLLSN